MEGHDFGKKKGILWQKEGHFRAFYVQKTCDRFFAFAFALYFPFNLVYNRSTFK